MFASDPPQHDSPLSAASELGSADGELSRHLPAGANSGYTLSEPASTTIPFAGFAVNVRPSAERATRTPRPGAVACFKDWTWMYRFLGGSTLGTRLQNISLCRAFYDQEGTWMYRFSPLRRPEKWGLMRAK